MCDGGVFSVPITMAILSAATAMYTQNEQRKMQQEAATTQLETQMQQQEYEKAVRQDTANLDNAKGIAERIGSTSSVPAGDHAETPTITDDMLSRVLRTLSSDDWA